MEMDYHSCKTHTMEEETLCKGPKSGWKEELGGGEWVSFNTLSLKKTKIWQDYFTSLELKRGEKIEFLCHGMEENGGLYRFKIFWEISMKW